MIRLDGNAVSKKRLEILKNKISQEFSTSGKRPGLVVIRVGEDPASKVYVARKIKACEDVGIESIEEHLDASTSQADLLKKIEFYNQSAKVHGILVQLPLPKQISEKAILDAVNPKKDVDGFHAVNLGRLVSREDGFVACTPLGIMNLLEDAGISVAGKSAVVVGRSRIVGRPVSLLLDHAGATVTVVHSQTPDSKRWTSSADILVVAVGKAHLIKAADVKDGAVVVDVGMNRLPDGKLVGDVDFENVSKKVSAITPVPGGVGPMTIATLLENTWKAFGQRSSIIRA